MADFKLQRLEFTGELFWTRLLEFAKKKKKKKKKILQRVKNWHRKPKCLEKYQHRVDNCSFFLGWDEAAPLYCSYY